VFESIAVVGATGAVGRIILKLLAERKFPFERIKLLASGRSAGKKVTFAGEQHSIEELTPDAFRGIDLAIGSTPDEVARDFVPWAVERGAVVVDESGYWRMKPDVPLVIPEVNPEAAFLHKGIIASPNCSTTQLVVALKPLHDAARVRRVVVSTYQATSGAGLGGCRDLESGSRAHLKWRRLRLPDICPRHRVQSHPSNRFAEARRVYLRRNEDDPRDSQDHRRRFDSGLSDVCACARKQLP